MEEKTKKNKVKPFIKWVGGKTQLISQLEKLLPDNYNNYFEPFVGGGALFFYLKPKKAYLNDINRALMWSYKNIKKKPKSIIRLLNHLHQRYHRKNETEREEFYYLIRSKYNSLPFGDLKKTAYLIFLNKTCYNGMYRENSKGFFNIPWGRYKNPKILDRENLLAVSSAIKNTFLLSVDFERAIEKTKKGDFIYFDPPYYPLNETSSFTSYSSNNFLREEQIRLKKVFTKLDKKGCFVMLSNSYTDFIRKLYKGYNQIIVMANRAINCKAEGRGKIKELVILNYKA